MAQKVEFALDAKDAGAVQAWLAVQRAAEQYNAVLGKIDSSQDAADKSGAEWGAKAKKLLADLETPQQRHNNRLAEYSTLRKRNLIDENQYAAAVRKSRQELDGATASGSKGITAVTTRLAGMAAGYVGVTSLVTAFANANRDAYAEAEKTASLLDATFKKLQVQGGLSDLKNEEAKRNVLKVAMKSGVSAEYATKAATQLVSSGFSVEDATGGALDAFIKTAAASNLLDQDPTQLVQASGQFLAAQGLDKNTANLARMLTGTQRLFKGTDLQVSDLSQLAGKSQSFAGKQAPEEVLAAFDVLREKTGADTASTALKIFGDRLMGAKGDKERETQLKRIGVKPEDVDLQGETISQALDRIEAGLSRVKVTERAGVLQKIFGTEASSPIEGLIRDRGKIGAARQMIGDQAGFDEDVRTATSGRSRAEQRQALARQLRAVERDQQGDLIREEMLAILDEQGYAAADRDRAAVYYDTARYLGNNPNSATEFAQFMIQTPNVNGQSLGPAAAQRVEARLQGIDPLVRALEENTKATNAAGGNAKPDVTPPAPVNSSLNDSRLKTGGRP